MTEWIISSSILILAVAVLRHVLRGKITRCFQYALWGLVLVRLLVPVSFGASAVSVMNIVPGGVLTALTATGHVNSSAHSQETTTELLLPGESQSSGQSQSPGEFHDTDTFLTTNASQSTDAQQATDASQIAIADLDSQTTPNTLEGDAGDSSAADDSPTAGATRTAGTARAASWNSVALVVWLTGTLAVGLFLLVTNARFSARLIK